MKLKKIYVWWFARVRIIRGGSEILQKKISAALKKSRKAISFSQIESNYFTRSGKSSFCKNCQNFYPSDIINREYLATYAHSWLWVWFGVSGNKWREPQQRPPPCVTVTARVSPGTQVWLRYYASLPSMRNGVILLKVLDSCCAPMFLLQLPSIILNRSPTVLQPGSELLFWECCCDLCYTGSQNVYYCNR